MRILQLIVLLGAFLAYLSSGLSPRYGVFFAFLSWTIPFWGILLGVLYVSPSKNGYGKSFLGWRKMCILGCLGLYAPFFWATYRVGSYATPTLPTHALTVLSYNVRVFNSYPLLEAESPNSSQTLPAWVGRQGADVQCLQEFYHLAGSAKFDMIQKLGRARGYHYHTGAPENLADSTGFFGLAIFSRFPIVKRGELPFKLSYKDYRLAIWADILHQKDTIRVINVHLEPFILGNKTGFEFFTALATGFAERAKQTEYLCQFIAKTPHKVILAGDFNDLPYSYTYQALKRQLYNAFEAKGAGFGITHRGTSALPALRIDSQFYSKGITCLAYYADYAQTASDHFPIVACYVRE